MEVTIRPADVGDERQIHALVTLPEVAETLGGLPTEPVGAWRRQLEESSPDSAYQAVAEHAGRVVGIASLEIPSNPRLRHSASIWIAVAPGAQRRGIGRRLIGAALDAGDRWFALGRVALNVHVENRAAIALYESMGFVTEAERRAGDMLRGNVPGDSLHMARLRPGFDLGTRRPEPIPPPRREPIGEVRIRPVGEDDAPGMARISSSYSAMCGTLQLPSMTASSWRKKLTSNPPGLHHVLGAEVGGELVGIAGLHGIPNPRLRHIYGLGMNVMESYQGRGIGSRLMEGLLDLADRWLSARRVELEVFVDNERAIQLYERAGFQREGVLRAFAFRDGVYADVLMMGRVR